MRIYCTVIADTKVRSKTIRNIFLWAFYFFLFHFFSNCFTYRVVFKASACRWFKHTLFQNPNIQSKNNVDMYTESYRIRTEALAHFVLLLNMSIDKYKWKKSVWSSIYS